MRRAVIALALVMGLVVSCDDTSEEAREAEVVGVLAEFDMPIIRARPALVAGKFARMAGSPFDFLRGSLPLYRHDARTGVTAVSVSRFALDVPLVPSLGDPHVENFGALRASDGTLAIEPNDFDAADRAPYLWDLRRLVSSLALAALVANSDDATARERTAASARAVARTVAEAYRTTVERAAAGSAASRFGADVTEVMANPITRDIMERSRRDEAGRAELSVLTEASSGGPRLRRGSIDPEDPQSLLVELPPHAKALLPAAVDAWRRSLLVAVPAEHLVLLDAARELGSGVSSWPRIRVVLLVRGPSDDPGDDRVLELKELADSGIAGLYPPGVHHDDVGRRVLETSRSAWARPDGEPMWGVTDWIGLRCQMRAETEGQKNVRVSRMVGARGSADALAGLGAILGAIVARVHTSGPDGLENARAIHARIVSDPAGFSDEQADAGVAYAAQTFVDHARFRRALVRLGPRLGVPFDASDAPSPSFAEVLGSPPPPEAVAQ